MGVLRDSRWFNPGAGARRLYGRAGEWVLVLCLVSGGWVYGQTSLPAAAQVPGQRDAAADSSGEALDRVVAVVNTQVILASDLDLERRLSQLVPGGRRRDATPAAALDRLTTRALIEQQIVQEDPNGMKISPAELEASLNELRQNLPACKTRDCTSPAGWGDYLATLGLDRQQVEQYWTNRMAVLRFIELRFRAGIRITPEEIRKYYEETLLPQYARRGDAPPLERISPRIQEVLLQQQVNSLLNDWLKSLQDQGQVEVVDPTLRKAVEVKDAAKAQGKDGSL